MNDEGRSYRPTSPGDTNRPFRAETLAMVKQLRDLGFEASAEISVDGFEYAKTAVDVAALAIMFKRGYYVERKGDELHYYHASH